MDQIYFWIIILFIIILILDYSDKVLNNKEKFSNLSNSNTTKLDSNYFEENRLFVYEPPYTTNAINLNNNNLNFKNFGTNGITPPFIKCANCNLQFDCTNFPYDVDDKNVNTCTKCNEKISLNKNNFPIYARSVGKPRVCKNLV